MTTDGDGDDGGRLHGRRGPQRGVDRGHEVLGAGDRARVPGRGTRVESEGRTVADPAAVALTAVRGAHGAAARVEALGPRLMDAIAAGDYLESGRLSLEIRSTLQRAETALAQVERNAPDHAAVIGDRFADARDRLAAVGRELAILVRAAPVLEEAGAGSEQRERDWKARRADASATSADGAAGAGGAGGANGDSAAPSWAADAAAIAPALGLGAVEIKTDATARAVTDAKGARGVALGDAVHLHPDRVQPGTRSGREVLAHELVHLAQARLPASRDAGRDAAEHEAASIARGVAQGGAARRPSHHIDLSRPAADKDADARTVAPAAPAAPLPDARRGAAYLRLRLDEIVDHAVLAIPYVPGTVERLTLDGPAFASDLARRVRAYVDAHGVPALRALLRPFDVEASVAGVAPALRREVHDPERFERVAAIVRGELASAVRAAFARVAPRVVAAADAAGGAAWLATTDVRHDGALDALVVAALLRPANAQVAVAAADTRRADTTRTADRRRVAQARELTSAAAAELLDASAARMADAAETVGPWGESIATEARAWVDRQQYWIHALPAARLAELGPRLDAGARTVAGAADGIRAIAAAYRVPAAGGAAPEAAPVRRVLGRYCRAIERAHAGGDAGKLALARAARAAERLPLDLVSVSLHDSRLAADDFAQAARDQAGGRVAHAARADQHALENQLLEQRQRLADGRGIDRDAGAELATAAGERASEQRLAGILAQARTFMLGATRYKDAFATVLYHVDRPVRAIRDAFARSQRETRAWLATQPTTAAVREQHRARRLGHVDAANAALAALVADGELEKRFDRAKQEVEDAQLREALWQLAILIGVSIITSQVASLVGAVARGAYVAHAVRGALLAERAAAVVGGVTTVAVDSVLMTGAQRAITRGATGNTAAGDLVANAATLAVLRPFTALGKQLDELDAGVNLTWVKHGKRWALQGAMGSLQLVGAAATAFAAQQAQQHGPADELQARAWLEQGASIVLAKLVSKRLAGLELRLHELGDAGGRALRRRLTSARRLAARAEDSGRTSALLEGVDAYKRLLGAEAQLLASRGDAADAEHVRANRADADELAPSRLAMLRWKAHGLEMLAADGGLWTGSRKHLEAAIADAGPAAAATVRREPDGRVRIRIDDQDVVLAPRGSMVDGGTATATAARSVAEPPATRSVAQAPAAQATYAERGRALAESGGKQTTADTYAVGPVPAGDAAWTYLADPAHWLPGRRALHERLLDRATAQALQFDAAVGGAPTLHATRGNTAAGKSTAIREHLPALARAAPTKAEPHRAINPDNFKVDLMDADAATPLTSTQVHLESSVLADRLRDRLVDATRADGEPVSMLVDKRLGGVRDVEDLAVLARRTGRQLHVHDVDAPLEKSLIGVLGRTPGGADPIPPFDQVADRGFLPARANRKAVMQLFLDDPTLGRYELFGTLPSGQKVKVVEIIDGVMTTFDESMLRALTRNQPDSVESFRNQRMTPEVIDDLVGTLEPGFAKKVREDLTPYLGQTWEEALASHSRRVASKKRSIE